MLTQGDDVEVHALAGRGWSISSIARHLGRDRKTVRAYVTGERTAGIRRSSVPDPLTPFVPYLAARFVDDPHLWLTALFDEVVPLGYPRSYPSFVRAVRAAGLRPHCEPCQGVSGRATIEIEHPPGAEIQWDWFERRKAPWGGTAFVLLGTLPHSSRVRGVLAPSLDQAHLIEAMDAVLRRLGGAEASPPAMTVRVNTGKAFVQGYYFEVHTPGRRRWPSPRRTRRCPGSTGSSSVATSPGGPLSSPSWSARRPSRQPRRP